MPKYEVVKSPGIQFPVGMTFETDELHASMLQHVKLAGGKKPHVDPKLTGDGYIDDEDAARDAAQAELEKRAPKVAATKVKVEKPMKTPEKPIDGPGENS